MDTDYTPRLENLSFLNHRKTFLLQQSLDEFDYIFWELYHCIFFMRQASEAPGLAWGDHHKRQRAKNKLSVGAEKSRR